MNQILDAPVAPVGKMEYAGFWIRFIALIIDGIVLSVIQWIIGFALMGGTVAEPMSFAAIFSLYNLISLVIGGVYFSVLESSERQATLGKMAVGIKVADEHGQRLTLANAIGRWACKFLSSLILGIGYIMAAFDIKKQGLHDKIAKTVVYYG